MVQKPKAPQTLGVVAGCRIRIIRPLPTGPESRGCVDGQVSRAGWRGVVRVWCCVQSAGWLVGEGEGGKLLRDLWNGAGGGFISHHNTGSAFAEWSWGVGSSRAGTWGGQGCKVPRLGRSLGRSTGHVPSPYRFALSGATAALSNHSQARAGACQVQPLYRSNAKLSAFAGRSPSPCSPPASGQRDAGPGQGRAREKAKAAVTENGTEGSRVPCTLSLIHI